MRKIATTIIMMLFSVIFLSGCGTPKVNLNDYVIIETSGYDGAGTIYGDYDYASFNKDFGDKIKITKAGEQEFMGLGTSPSLIFEYCLASFDKSNRLSNGDVVHVSWTVDESVTNYFNFKLEYSDFDYTVSGLVESSTPAPAETNNSTNNTEQPNNIERQNNTEQQVNTTTDTQNEDIFAAYKDLEAIDPFEYCTANYDNAEPNIAFKLDIDRSAAPEMQYVDFDTNYDPYHSNYYNGDIITVTARLKNNLSADDFVEKTGKRLEPMVKEYVIEGVPHYAMKYEDIPEGFLEEMKSYSERAYRELAERDWPSKYTLKDLEYIGYYFLAPISNGMITTHGRIYQVFLAQINDSSTGNDYDVYSCSSAWDIIVQEDGSYDTEECEYRSAFDNDYVNLDGGEITSFSGLVIHGYNSINDLFNSHINSLLNSYEYSTDIQK